MSKETIRLIRDGEKEGKRYGGGGRRRLYTCHYTVTTRLTAALRWAVMRAILILIARDKVTRQCPQTTAFEEKGEPKAYQPNALPLGQTSSQMMCRCSKYTIT